MSNNSNSDKGIGFFGVLTILFIALKLTNTIDWSWWWVLSPIWIAASVVFLAIGGLFLWAIISDNNKKKGK